MQRIMKNSYIHPLEKLLPDEFERCSTVRLGASGGRSASRGDWLRQCSMSERDFAFAAISSRFVVVLSVRDTVDTLQDSSSPILVRSRWCHSAPTTRHDCKPPL